MPTISSASVRLATTATDTVAPSTTSTPLLRSRPRAGQRREAALDRELRWETEHLAHGHLPSACLSSLALAKRPERCAELVGEELRLLPGCEVHALGDLVVVDEVGIHRLGPGPRSLVTLLWEALRRRSRSPSWPATASPTWRSAPPSPSPGAQRWRVVDRLCEQSANHLLEARRLGMTNLQLVERYSISLSSVKRILKRARGT